MYKYKSIQSLVALTLIFFSPMLFAGDYSIINDENLVAEYVYSLDEKFATTQKDLDVDALIESLGFEVDYPYKKAPDFSLPDIDGNMVTFSELPGDLIVFNMWANWCPPCQKEKPFLQKFYEEMSAEDYSLITAHYTGTNEEVKKYMTDHGYTFNVIIDEKGENIGIPYGVKYIPTTFLVDDEGYIRGKKVGITQWDCPKTIATFKKIIDELD